MNSRELLESVKKDTKVKIFGAVPAAILSICFLLTLLVANIFNWSSIAKILGCLAAISMLAMFGFVIYSEKIRKKLLFVIDCEFLLTYLQVIKECDNDSNHFLDVAVYYDIIDKLRTVLFFLYTNVDIKDEKHKEIINSLYNILRKDSANGLSNPFVYENRKGFSVLCEYIIEYSKQNTPKASNEWHINQKYDEIRKEFDKYSKKPKLGFYIGDTQRFIRCVHLLVIAMCIYFFFQKNNSNWFNFVTIFLLALDFVPKQMKFEYKL